MSWCIYSLDEWIVKDKTDSRIIREENIVKATAIQGGIVQTLCSKWNIPLSNAVAFGDNYNDVEMLEPVGKGILMGNAPDNPKKRIKIQTADNNHD